MTNRKRNPLLTTIISLVNIPFGLILLFIGTNLLTWVAADIADEYFPAVSIRPMVLQIPEVVPDWIEKPINATQEKAFLLFGEVTQLDPPTFSPKEGEMLGVDIETVD